MRLVLFAILIGCGHPPKQTPAMPSSSPPPPTAPADAAALTECQRAIAGFASADPTRLGPLPASCTVADVSAVLRSRGGTSRGVLGKGRATGLTVHHFASDRLPEIQVWVDASGKVVLIDADGPPGERQAWLDALGAPETMLDYRFRRGALKDAEKLWLSRGIVVIAVTGAPAVKRFGVFAPTTLADYEANLRYADIESD